MRKSGRGRIRVLVSGRDNMKVLRITNELDIGGYWFS